jgi:hypothetical protein
MSGMKTKTTHYVEAWTDWGVYETFHCEEKAIRWLVKMTRHGGSGWYLVHDHPYEEGDCACVQYLVDHNPQVINGQIVSY